jgi:hypothetical protein
MAVLIPAIAVLTGCAVRPAVSAAPSGGERCMSAAAVSGRYVLPPDSIIFETLGPVNYRNILARPCVGLARLGRSAAIVFENSTGGRICAGDRVRLFDARDTGSRRLAEAPVCELGQFMPSAR